jgi:hypothetical protein
VLRDESALNDYKVEDGHTIHMVARPPDYEQIRNQISQREERNSTMNSSVRDSMQSLFSLSSLLGGNDMTGSGLSRPNERTEINPSTEISTSLEPIRQSLLTMHTLLSTMSDGSAGNHAHRRITPHPSSLPRPRDYFVGQWLDVKDTVNQWLEATVMQVDHEQTRVFVHYNGWSHSLPPSLSHPQLLFS